MTNTKNTKRALIASVISLILCFSMLVGTTFAWFTDSVTSANNVIVAGNLDLTLEYWNGTAWTDVEGSDEILDADALWEPGYTQVVYFKLTNVGSLALKYQMGVNIVSETAGVNVYGDEFLLSDYIYFDVVEGVDGSTAPYADRDEAMENATETVLISEGYSKSGNLVAEAAPVYLAMIVYMPTTVGNVANHNGTDVPEILLGVNAIATQYTNESDSFDEYYDGGAAWLEDAEIDWYTENPDATEFTIGSAEELAGLAAIVNGTTGATTYGARAATLVDDFAGKTITLTSDIDLNNRLWTPIGNWDYAFSGTFDGNGHVINNLYVNDADGEGVGFFGVVADATITGLTLNNVKVKGYARVAGVAGATYPATISDCHITGDVEIVAEYAYAAGIAGDCYYGTQVSDCSVIANENGLIQAVERNAVGGITAWLKEGDHKVTDCTVKNLDLVGWTNVGGITGLVHYSNTIEGCTVENVTLLKTRVEGNPAIGLIAGGYSYHASNASTLKNNTAKNVTLNGTHVAYESYNVLYGSEYDGKTTTNFVLDNNVTENITNNLVEITKISDGLAEDENGTKLIHNAAGLLSLSGTKLDGNYKLIADIDLGGAEFKAMSAWYKTASFDGNGHTISNAKVVSGDNDNGTEQASIFFVSTNGSLTVSDLTLKDITVTTKNIDNGYAAAVIGYCEGKAVLNNVDVVNAKITGSKSSGALIGHLTPAGSLTATDCDVAGSVTISDFEADGHYAGQYVGTIAGNTALTNCTANVALGGKLISKNVGTIYGRKLNAELTVNGATVVTSAAEMTNAVAAGVTNLYLADGEYNVANCGGKTLTVSGTKNAVLKLYNEGEDGCDYGFDGSTVTFNGVTIDTTANTGNYKGYARMTATYNDCTFVGGGFTTFETASFNNCTVALNGYVWTWGAKAVNFTECTFTGDSRAILAHGSASTVITVTDCDFAATAKGTTYSGDWTAAVEIDPTGSNTYTINFVGENNLSEYYSGWTRVKDGSTGHVITGVN